VSFGIVAQGQFAVGVVAMGLVSVGIVAMGGLAVGIVALGGIALGGLALGGVALGWQAVGGVTAKGVLTLLAPVAGFASWTLLASRRLMVHRRRSILARTTVERSR
jgi:hypothetical protein